MCKGESEPCQSISLAETERDWESGSYKGPNELYE